MCKIAEAIPEAILITQVLYFCPLVKKTQRKKMRFKREVGITGHSSEFHVTDGGYLP